MASIRHRPPRSEHYPPSHALHKVLTTIVNDKCEALYAKGAVRIYEKPSQNMSELDDDSIDLVVTSPPYLNNFDFAEMTRMYLYFWGIASSWKDITTRIRTQLIVNTTTALQGHKDRQHIYRSALPDAVRRDADIVVESLSQRRKVKAGKKDYNFLIYPYLSQMQQVLRETRRALRPGAPLHMMVSDAALYGIHVPAPQWLARIMTHCEFADVQCNMVRSRGHRWILDKREGSPQGLGEYYLYGRARVMPTLYQLADSEIRACVADYLALAADTTGFATVAVESVNTRRKAMILLAGLNAPLDDDAPDAVVREWERRRKAIPVDIEAGITASVYINLRGAGSLYLDEVRAATDGFSNWSPDYIHDNPHTLPLLQHLAGVFSKAALKKQVGSVSDTSISRPAAIRLANLLDSRVVPDQVREGEILQRLEATLEGIVRDLVGRVMIETIVQSALERAGVPYKRENEYDGLSGVVYKHRADFIVPNERTPRAFIEVRKSSSRHASLYAKDKMFSAINWKGMHQDMLGILVVDGEWTTDTLVVMAKIFDYVVPLRDVNDLPRIIAAYLEGDRTKLRWLINFSVEGAGQLN